MKSEQVRAHWVRAVASRAAVLARGGALMDVLIVPVEPVKPVERDD